MAAKATIPSTVIAAMTSYMVEKITISSTAVKITMNSGENLAMTDSAAVKATIN
jgi:hypothetical protein